MKAKKGGSFGKKKNLLENWSGTSRSYGHVHNTWWYVNLSVVSVSRLGELECWYRILIVQKQLKELNIQFSTTTTSTTTETLWLEKYTNKSKERLITAANDSKNKNKKLKDRQTKKELIKWENKRGKNKNSIDTSKGKNNDTAHTMTKVWLRKGKLNRETELLSISAQILIMIGWMVKNFISRERNVVFF